MLNINNCAKNFIISNGLSPHKAQTIGLSIQFIKITIFTILLGFSLCVPSQMCHYSWVDHIGKDGNTPTFYFIGYTSITLIIKFKYKYTNH